MPTDLRTRLKALVEEWRESASEHAVLMFPPAERRVYGIVAKQLAALLAESEPCTVQECKDLGQCACFREPDMVASAPGGHEFHLVHGVACCDCPSCREAARQKTILDGRD